MKIGIIGTGMLGSAVGLRLLESGFDLTAYNRTREKTRQLEEKGAKVADNPKQVAENSELVIIVVRDAKAVHQVSFEQNGIINGKHDKLTVADMSTISPFESKTITREFDAHGITKLDIPVMGGPNVAISGDLVVMTSGDRKAFETCKKVLERIGNKVFFLGESGAAHSVKLAMNLQIAMLALSLSEGIMLMRGAKIDPKVFLEILNSTYFKTGMSENKAYKMIEDKFEPTFTLENLKKDISKIIETANHYETQLPMIKKAEEIYQKATEQGFGKIDYTGILAYIEKINKQ
jgi:3-hydroxyisobutyrate dehydrogenase